MREAGRAFGFSFGWVLGGAAAVGVLFLCSCVALVGIGALAVGLASPTPTPRFGLTAPIQPAGQAPSGMATPYPSPTRPAAGAVQTALPAGQAQATPTVVFAEGTRQRPYPFNSPGVAISRQDNNNSYRVTVLELIPDATGAVKTANMFNREPAPDHLYVMVRVRVQYLASGAPGDRATEVNWLAFRLLSADGQIREPAALVAPPPTLQATLIPGGTTEGHVIFETPKSTQAVAVVFKYSDSGQQGAWYALR